MPLPRVSRFALAALLFASLAIRLLWINTAALAHDEPFTVYWSQQPMAAFWTMLRSENNPPLHFLITRWWSAVVPFEPAWLRVPSAVASALSVWPLFLLAHRLAGLRAAAVACSAMALSNYHHGFAQEVRAYALFMLLAVWSMWLIVRLSASTSRRSALPLALVNALMVYTHFFGWLMIGVQAIAVLALPGLRAHWRPFLRVALFTLASFGPYLLVFAARAQAGITEGTWLEPPAWEELYNMIWRWSNAPVVAIAFLLLIGAALLRKRQTAPIHGTALIWALVPLLGMFAISFTVPVFLDRYLVFAAPGFALLVAASIEALRMNDRWRSVLAVLSVAALALTFKPAATGPYAPEGVPQLVNRWCRPECVVQVAPPWYWLNYLAAKDINELRSDRSDLLRSGVFLPDSAQAAALGPTVLVDASGDTRNAEAKAALRRAYARTDSVEADHRVWVHRFWNED